MPNCGVEVVETRNLLTETFAVAEGEMWILDNQVGLGCIDEPRGYLGGRDDRHVAKAMIGGLSIHDSPNAYGVNALEVVRDAAAGAELLPPVSNGQSSE